MRKTCLSILLLLVVYVSLAQTESHLSLDLDIETNTGNAELSKGWFKATNTYIIKKDSVEKHGGNYSISITSQAGDERKAGVATFSFPAEYVGKTIELRGYLKLEKVSEGWAGLFLRLDGESSVVLSYDVMQKKNLKGTKDWALYSVKLPLPENAKTIRIGGGLWGQGQVWIDDLELLIDGKDIRLAKQKEKSAAERDTSFNDGSDVSITQVNPPLIADLAVLGKVWGFLKYHHPSVTSGKYNWDFELFRIMPKILGAKDLSERNALLTDWIKGLGNVESRKTALTETADIKQTPDLAWINKANLGDELSNLLLTLKDAEKRGDYYVDILEQVPVPEFRHEPAYSQFKYPDVGFRLLSLFRYWNIVQYYFPYKYLIGEDWNTVLQEYIPNYIAASSEIEYEKNILSLVSRIHDSHAYVTGADQFLKTTIGLKHPAIGITFIENRAVVTDYLDEDLGRRTGLKKGDVIDSVNGVSVDAMIKKQVPYIPASNYPTKLRKLSSQLLKTNDPEIKVSYVRGDSLGEAQLSTYSQKEIDIYKNTVYTDTCLKIISDTIAYFHPGSVKVKYLPNIMDRIMTTKALIIDLRTYPNESIVQQMGEYLFAKPTEFAKFALANAIQPGLFTFGGFIKIGKDNPEYYKGKIVIVVNETTQSNAEFTAMGFRAAKGAMVIGSQTAGADGNVVPAFNLPGGLSTVFSGLGVYYPDGRETQRIGIVPDLEVRPTINGVREGKDEVLEKALELIKGM